MEDLYPAGVTIQQWSADAAISLTQLQIAETRIGVDGFMAAGFVPRIQIVTINLEASSPSFRWMANIWEMMRANRTIYQCGLVVTAPSIGYTFNWKNGVLHSGTPFAAVSQVLGPTSWIFHFERMDSSRI
ncbi:MAG: hypothetical protein LIP77_03560 [Planctomycetes bacterium]|nr:hypothetical protein [Planctomycetota bacterium]